MSEKESRLRRSYRHATLSLYVSLFAVASNLYVAWAGYSVTRTMLHGMVAGTQLAVAFWMLWLRRDLRQRIAITNVESVPSMHVIRLLRKEETCRPRSRFNSRSTTNSSQSGTDSSER